MSNVEWLSAPDTREDHAKRQWTMAQASSSSLAVGDEFSSQDSGASRLLYMCACTTGVYRNLSVMRCVLCKSLAVSDFHFGFCSIYWLWPLPSRDRARARAAAGASGQRSRAAAEDATTDMIVDSSFLFLD